MDKIRVIEKIRETGVVPVIRADSPERARAVAAALIEGGVDVLEITLTTPGAIELIGRLTGEYKGAALIGAGTVLDEDEARKCVEAGAKFIVSPVLHRETVAFCNQSKIVVMSGALTPTEIVRARQAGADIIKIFPVSAMGGASYLKAVRAVFPQFEFIPTGGVNLENAVEYIKAGASAVGIGGELMKESELVITKHARNLRDKIETERRRKKEAADA